MPPVWICLNIQKAPFFLMPVPEKGIGFEKKPVLSGCRKSRHPVVKGSFHSSLWRIDRSIKAKFHRQIALKLRLFLVGSECRLRIEFGTPHTARDADSHLWLAFAEQMCWPFVPQALPRSCKNDVIYTLSTKPYGFVLFLLVWILFFMDMLFCDTMPHGFGWDTYFHLTAYLL